VKFYLVIPLFLLFSCSINERSIKAPIKEESVNAVRKIKRDVTRENDDFLKYIVKNNDTIYSISLIYNVNYKKIIAINNLNDSDLIFPGQALLIPKNNKILKKKQKDFVQKKLPVKWTYPIRGKIFYNYDPKKNINGIGIFSEGDVYSIDGGKVVYSGDGLKAYGNMVILKHNDDFLSIYAKLAYVEVKEGQMIQKKQLIGKTGFIMKNKTGLHFEIRYKGEPVNPQKYLNF
jgi:lipoprotein NlpD